MIEPLPPPPTKDAATSPISPPTAAAAAVTPAPPAEGAPSSPPSASPAPGPSVPRPQDKTRKKKMSDEEILEKLRKTCLYMQIHCFSKLFILLYTLLYTVNQVNSITHTHTLAEQRNNPHYMAKSMWIPQSTVCSFDTSSTEKWFSTFGVEEGEWPLRGHVCDRQGHTQIHKHLSTKLVSLKRCRQYMLMIGTRQFMVSDNNLERKKII